MMVNLSTLLSDLIPSFILVRRAFFPRPSPAYIILIISLLMDNVGAVWTNTTRLSLNISSHILKHQFSGDSALRGNGNISIERTTVLLTVAVVRLTSIGIVLSGACQPSSVIYNPGDGNSISLTASLFGSSSNGATYQVSVPSMKSILVHDWSMIWTCQQNEPSPSDDDFPVATAIAIGVGITIL
jgi:hypothetical protein